VVDWGIACLLAVNCGSKFRCADNGRGQLRRGATVSADQIPLLGCTALGLLVALVVVSGAILNTHLYLLPLHANEKEGTISVFVFPAILGIHLPTPNT